MCTFLGIISVINVLRHRRQNYLFLGCGTREEQEKYKACILTVYQDVSNFSLLKNSKNE